MIANLTAEDSAEHARLLNAFVQAQERYKSLLPRPVAAGVAAGPAQSGEALLHQVQEADRDRLLAREALYRFRSSHGIP
jgi:hypothetical protein